MNDKHTIWFTGLSRSGKTTLAESLAAFLQAGENGSRFSTGG